MTPFNPAPCPSPAPAGTHMFWWACFMARAASDIVLSTSVLVVAFSSASRWNSMVDRVPSSCANFPSYRFLRFSACSAAEQERWEGRDVLWACPHTQIPHHPAPEPLPHPRTGETCPMGLPLPTCNSAFHCSWLRPPLLHPLPPAEMPCP